MIPDSMIATSPEIGIKVTELMDKRICRFCLTETEDLVNIEEDNGGSKNTNWKVISTACLSVSSLIGERLPKYVCDGCYEFVEKCYQFQKLRKKAEMMLVIYPLTGSWSQSLDVPEWLRSAKKRKREEETVDSLSAKKVCSGERKDAEVQTDSFEKSPVESSPARSGEPLVLQSPTITSEDTVQATVILKRVPQPTVENSAQPVNQQSQQCFEANYSTQTVIQYCQSQHSQHHNQPLQNVNNFQFPENLSSTQCHQCPPPFSSVQTTQQNSKLSATNPILWQQLQKPPQSQPCQSQQAVSSQFQPSLPTTSSAQTPTFSPLQLQQAYYDAPSHNHTIQPSSFHCPACSDRFTHPNHLNFHMRTHDNGNDGGKFCCVGCGDQLLSLASFVVHLERKHLDSRLCFLCGKQVASIMTMLKHLQFHRVAQMTFACNFCLLIFISPTARIKHVNLVHRAEVCQEVRSVVKCTEKKIEQ